MQIKTYGLIEKASKVKEGEVEFVVSTNAWDAHGERIDVDGINFKDFKKNPVVLWGHDGFNLPIAKATKIWKEGGKLMAKAMFDLSDEFATKVYEKIRNGFLNAVSIGGLVEEWGKDGLTISKMNMKEFSVVSIPANPQALATAKSLTTEEQETVDELTQMAKAYARKQLSEGQLMEEVNLLEKLIATLKEVAQSEQAQSETQDVETAKTRRVTLSVAQSVDKQAEKVIKTIKLKELK